MRTRAALLAALAMPATAVIRVIEKGTPDGPQPKFRKSTWRNRITSHETFTHDSLDSLGYDWERIANPNIKPRYPLKVYLPQTTDDIVKVLKEVKALGEKLAIRSKGHSSNDLVLAEAGGSVLVTEKLNQVLEINEDNMTVTVQAGAVSAQIDDRLSTMGLGLPIIGDHNHITVGGFASVGGISPASHRFGLFVDTVQRIEYVNWDGEVVVASRTENPEQFFAVLTGRGQHGVIATITVQIIRVDKYGTVLENHQNHYYDVDAFIQGRATASATPAMPSWSGASGSTTCWESGASVPASSPRITPPTRPRWRTSATRSPTTTSTDSASWPAAYLRVSTGPPSWWVCWEFCSAPDTPP